MSEKDCEDISSWVGTRNQAKPCEWNELSDESKASLMLEGVNLFSAEAPGSNLGTALSLILVRTEVEH